MSAAELVLLSSSLEREIPALEWRAEVWGRSWVVRPLGSLWESPHSTLWFRRQTLSTAAAETLLRSEFQFISNVIVVLSRQARFSLSVVFEEA